MSSTKSSKGFYKRLQNSLTLDYLADICENKSENDEALCNNNTAQRSLLNLNTVHSPSSAADACSLSDASCSSQTISIGEEVHIAMGNADSSSTNKSRSKLLKLFRMET